MPRKRSISRRRFAQLFGAGTAYVVARGASTARPIDAWKPAPDLSKGAGVVRLNSNENPYGPSPRALRAMTDAFRLAGRYPDEHADLLIETLATVHGVQPDQILL